MPTKNAKSRSSAAVRDERHETRRQHVESLAASAETGEPLPPPVPQRSLPDDGIDIDEGKTWDKIHAKQQKSVSAVGAALHRLSRLSAVTTFVPQDRLSGRSPRLPRSIQDELPLPDESTGSSNKHVELRLPAGLLEQNDSHFKHWLARAVRATGIQKGELGSRGLHLTNVVFQPMQNAHRYGSIGQTDTPEESDARYMSMRIVPPAQRSLRSYAGYQIELAKRHIHTSRFLEVVIADAGPGIARHFFLSSKPADVSPQLLDTDFYREWIYLQLAFERHQSSRRSLHSRTANRDVFSPGVGLFAMLAGLKMLGGFFEVRTGRLRMFRYAFPDEVVDVAEPLLWPRRLPTTSPMIRGTVVRILVPLYKDSSRAE